MVTFVTVRNSLSDERNIRYAGRVWQNRDLARVQTTARCSPPVKTMAALSKGNLGIGAAIGVGVNYNSQTSSWEPRPWRLNLVHGKGGEAIENKSVAFQEGDGPQGVSR